MYRWLASPSTIRRPPKTPPGASKCPPRRLGDRGQQPDLLGFAVGWHGAAGMAFLRRGHPHGRGYAASRLQWFNRPEGHGKRRFVRYLRHLHADGDAGQRCAGGRPDRRPERDGGYALDVPNSSGHVLNPMSMARADLYGEPVRRIGLPSGSRSMRAPAPFRARRPWIERGLDLTVTPATAAPASDTFRLRSLRSTTRLSWAPPRRPVDLGRYRLAFQVPASAFTDVDTPA